MEDDPAIALHIPGMRLRLIGSEKVAEGPRLQWTVSSYTSLVLKRLLRVAELLEDSSARIRFLDLADLIWTHIERRRIEAANGRGLWDEPTQVFTGHVVRPLRGAVLVPHRARHRGAGRRRQRDPVDRQPPPTS